jgi:hypothetical protein
VDADGAVILEAYGIVIDSELALPIPVARSRETPHVSIVLQEVDDRGVQFAPVDGVDDEEIWIEMGWDGDRTVLRFAETIAELIGDRINIDPLDSDDADYVAHMVVDHVIPRWLALHGDVVLHAGSAVSPHGHAIALIGDPGLGKSSLTIALGRAGWLVLGDDACRLVRAEDGWHAHPAYPGARLLGDSRRALAPDAPSTPMTHDAEKHRIVSGVPMASTSARLGMIVELGGESDTPTLQPLSYSQATASLTRHSFFLASRLADVAPQAFTLSSALAADVASMLLEFPRRWDAYPQLIDLLERQLAAVAA